MSEAEATTVPTTEETPAETPAAATEETPAETPAAEETPAETPAAVTTEETPAETPAAATTDDQPAVTEVTEVTVVTEEAPKEEAAEVEVEEAPKEKEAPKEEKKKEVKKKPKASKVVDYRTSKAGWVQRQGLLFKKWQRLYVCLDEEESVLRFWKKENKTGSDGALFMKYCADVCLPQAEATTTWPDDTANRQFVVCSPFRAFFLVAESQEERDDWMQKLTAAKDKWNTEGRKVVSTELISEASVKSAFNSAAANADKELKKEETVKENTEETPATEAAPAAGESEAVTVEVDVETPTSTEPPKPAEEAPKDETPAEEAPKDETPAEEAPKDETPAEEAPKDETPAEEAPKDETPAAAEGEAVKAED